MLTWLLRENLGMTILTLPIFRGIFPSIFMCFIAIFCLNPLYDMCINMEVSVFKSHYYCYSCFIYPGFTLCIITALCNFVEHSVIWILFRLGNTDTQEYTYYKVPVQLHLRPCLCIIGGNSRTAMVAALSPADINYDETLSTLRYFSLSSGVEMFGFQLRYLGAHPSYCEICVRQN